MLLKAFVSFTLSLAVITGVKAGERWIKVVGGNWEPSPQILSELKTKIEGYVKSQGEAQGREFKNWQDYTFQYQGEEEKGRKYIFVNALCNQSDRQGLDKKIVIIFDGGTCYFNVKYDPSKRLFFDLLINGEA